MSDFSETVFDRDRSCDLEREKKPLVSSKRDRDRDFSFKTGIWSRNKNR